MRTIKNNVLRREVVEAYLRYDTEKKNALMPDFADWDWNDPNYLCCVLCQGDYKGGVITGFSTWNQVEITLDDLMNCAVIETIAKEKNGPRDLRGLKTKGCLCDWKPDRKTRWFERAERGDSFGPCEPFILRQAVKGEREATWYVEDGSGRAAAMVSKAGAYSGKSVVAYGYLGIVPDRKSCFMCAKLSELFRVGR